METGRLADILARVLRGAVCNDRVAANFELGLVPALLTCTCPTEERESLFAQTFALFGRTWGTPQNEAKAGLVWKRGREDRVGRRGLRNRCGVLGRKRSAEVRRRRLIGQRTTDDYYGWVRLWSDGAQVRQEREILPEPCPASLDRGRVTRIFSVRMREVVVTEGIAEDICKRKGGKLIQQRALI